MRGDDVVCACAPMTIVRNASRVRTTQDTTRFLRVMNQILLAAALGFDRCGWNNILWVLPQDIACRGLARPDDCRWREAVERMLIGRLLSEQNVVEFACRED